VQCTLWIPPGDNCQLENVLYRYRNQYFQIMILHFGIAMRGSGSGKKFPNAVNNFRISLLSM